MDRCGTRLTKYQGGKGAWRSGWRDRFGLVQSLTLYNEGGDEEWILDTGDGCLLNGKFRQQEIKLSTACNSILPFPFLLGQNWPPKELRASDILGTTKGTFTVHKTTRTWWVTTRADCFLTWIFQEKSQPRTHKTSRQKTKTEIKGCRSEKMEGHSKFLEKMTRLQTKVFIFLKKINLFN